MMDDFTVFWQNNERARALFYDLLARAQREEYDDDFLARLAAYREAGGDAAHADIFAAEYLLYEGDAETACICAERAYRVCPLEPCVWQALEHAYNATGHYAEALVMQCRRGNLFELSFSLSCPCHVLTEDVCARMSIALGLPIRAPLCTHRLSLDENGELRRSRAGMFMGEFLPQDAADRPPYYVGVYTEQGLFGAKAWQAEAVRTAPGCAVFGGGDMVFDLMRARRVSSAVTIDLETPSEIILPIMGTGQLQVPIIPQQLRVKTASVDGEAWISPATTNYFRLTESAVLSSNAAFIVGTPIRVGHSPTRKKLVLNILVDALPWKIIGRDFAASMPLTHRFFQKGTIFTQHFSAAEHTYSSIPNIETGMYVHHTQIFQDKIAYALDQNIITFAERMRDAGYATSVLAGEGAGIYTGVMRGYDRILVQPFFYQAYDAVECTIRYLTGTDDADQLIFLHTADVHPSGQPAFQFPAAVQARLPLTQRLTVGEDIVPSPYLPPSPARHASFWQGVADTDRALGMLFSYLEEHYAPEDYIVSLYSDHGVSIFQSHQYIVSEDSTNATWMMRGAGVPEGIIADELTSTVDLYPTLAHLLDIPVGDNVDGVLPKIFGGTGREIAFSNSIFPGKPYFLAARARSHTLCLETEDAVGMDGTVDFAGAKLGIYPRAHELEEGYAVDSPELRAFFYPRVREFVQEIGNNGEVFPPPTEK